MHSLMISACAFVALSVVGTARGGTGWSYYDGPLSPNLWHTKYPHCGGRMQSPINIVTSKILYDRNLQPFDLSQYNACVGCIMTLENVDGHTVEVEMGYNQDLIVIQGGNLPDEYILDQFHFHWGATDDEGSEHMLNGKPAQMEMHLVHHTREFNKSSSAEQPFGLAVLGFFIEVGEYNPNFEKLLMYFDNVTYKNDEAPIQSFPVGILLPPNALKNGSYYRYYGSLTTPPCYESVIWTLFTENIQISQSQLDAFRSLRTRVAGDTDDTAISNDFRPVQPLNERSIISNDKSLQSLMVQEIVQQLTQEIKDLQDRCTGAGSRTESLGPWMVVMLAVGMLMMWRV